MQKSLSVCSWSLQPGTPEQLVSSVHACGLQRVQICLDQFARNERSIDELRNSLADKGVEICSGMMSTIDEDYSTLASIRETGGVTPDRHWESNRAHAIGCARVANSLGIRLVTLHAGFIDHLRIEEYRTMCARIAELDAIFNSQGVSLALETGQESAETLDAMLREPGLERVGVNFDPANMILYAMGDPIDAMETLRDRILQVHMKDAIPTKVEGAWGTEVIVGAGSVDWKSFFAMIRRIPREIDVVIERESGTDRIADVRSAIEIAHEFGYTP